MIAPMLTVKTLCDHLKVHPSTIYRLLKTGQLAAFKVSSDWRFNVEEIDGWRIGCEKGSHATNSVPLVRGPLNGSNY